MQKNDFKISVITPVYNCERYLDETIESVVSQSIGFDNIQHILVNDGSTDGSGAICKRYAEAHSDNVIYIEKENGGVSSARNAGLAHASGKYTIFLDGDDHWDSKSFDLIFDFFEDHPEDFDVCSCRIKFFGDYEDRDHPLDYKFGEKARIADLSKEPEMISSTIGSVAVRTSAIGDTRFNEKISSGEDSVFVNSLLLGKPYLGILPEALFYYRRNRNAGSGSSSAVHKASWYTTVPEEYYLGLCRKSLEAFGEVPTFIQHVIMYDLRWRKFDPSMMSILTEDEKRRHIEILQEVLSHVDDKVIRKAEGFTQYRRLYFFELKHGYDLPEKAELKDGVLRYGKTRIFNYKLRNVIRVTVLEFDDSSLVIEGMCGIKGIAEDYTLAAKDEKGAMYTAELQPYDKRDVRGFTGEYVICGEAFRITMPVKPKMEVALILKTGGEEIALQPSYDDYLRIPEKGTANYCFREGYLIKNENGYLSITKDTPVNRLKAEAEWKKAARLSSDPDVEKEHSFEIELGKVMRSAKAGNNILFISGRADDMLQENMQRVYDIVDLPKMFYAKRGIYQDPQLYKMAAELVCSAKVIVTDDYVPVLRDYHKLPGQHIVQLWHATGAFKHFGKDSGTMLPAKDRLYHKDYDLVTVSSEDIRQIYADCFQIPVSRVKATGIARTDDLFDDGYRNAALQRVFAKHPELMNKELILYAPTFRDIPGVKRSHFAPPLDFGVLSEKLGQDRNFVLCPHPLMTDPVITEDHSNVFEIRDVSTADMMFAADLLVTDYSSVIFEFALLGKPMVFYCYDYDTYERDFYLDTDTELPGPVFKTQDEFIGFLVGEQGKNGHVDRNSDSFCEKYLGACDGHSSERIADLITDLYHDKEI